jgi:chitodextrinase
VLYSSATKVRPGSRNQGGTRPAGLACLLVLLLSIAWLLGSPGVTEAAGTVLLGDQAIEAGNDSNVAGRAEAFKATATGTGALATLTVYVGSTSATTKLVAGVYLSNSAGTHPTTLLAQGSLSGPTKGAWNTITLTSQPQIVAGTPYWITILSPAGFGTMAFRDVLGGGLSEASSQTTLTGLPTSWTSGTVYKDGPLSAYGTTSLAPDTAAPRPPGSPAVTAQTQTALTMSWAASTDDVGVTGYNLYRDGSKVATTTATSFTFGGLACGTTYALAVEAFDAAGNVSGRSATGGSTSGCPDTTPPTAPADLVPSGSTTTTASLTWSASSDDRGVTGYGVYVNGGLRTSTTSTAATVGGLPCGTSYPAAVDATDAAGNRSAKATTTISTAACPSDASPPSTPASLTVSSQTQSSVVLSWAPSTDDVGVTGYGLFLGGSPNGMTGATSATFSFLACGSTYLLGVDAFDSAGNTSAVATISARTAGCPDVTPPSVALTAPSDGATVSGLVAVKASAQDNVGVVGVQFRLDGAKLGPEDGAAPYEVSWNSAAATNGTHTLGADARDAGGNVTSSVAVAITVGNAIATTPTPVPAAGVNGITVGPGFVASTGHQVVRTASNVVYVLAADDNPCQSGGSGVVRAWKGLGAQAANAAVPTSFVEVDAAHHPVSGGTKACQYDGNGSVLFSPDSRLDSSGTIHTTYIDTFNRNLYYQTFSTLTDTWGARSTIATFASRISGFSWPRGSQAALTLDANDVPHVAYATYGTPNQISYTNKVSGSWATPATIFAGPNQMQPSLTTAPDGTIHLAWLDNALATSPTIRYARSANGAWGTVETVSAGDTAVLSNAAGDQVPSVATDANGRPYVCYLDGSANGPNNYVRVRYRAAGGVWTDDSPPGTAGGAPKSSGTLFAHAPHVYVSQAGGTFVFLGHDVLVSPGGYSYQVGGPAASWSPYATLDPRNKNNTTAGYVGLDGSVSTRYDPLRDNNPGIVDLVYYDEADGTPGYPHHATVFYKAVQLR